MESVRCVSPGHGLVKERTEMHDDLTTATAIDDGLSRAGQEHTTHHMAQLMDLITDDLWKESDLFETIGLVLPASRLRKLALRLGKITLSIRSRNERMSNEALAQAEQSSLNVLNAALAGIAVGERRKEV